MANWTELDVPDLSGRAVLVTGANSGLGLRTAWVLAGRRARVLLACRSLDRGAAAAAAIGGTAELVQLDLADLDSVRRAAAEVRERTDDKLDVLINNAGVMFLPHERTPQGFERQFGTNHLGHAALTWLLMPALRNRPGARVVTLSSLWARFGRIHVPDPNFESRRYSANAAYAQSKLANLLFALELDRHAKASGLDLISVAAHPGYTATSLNTNSANSWPGLLGRTLNTVYGFGDRLIGQPVERGVLPTLYAATAPGVVGGEYYGPDGLGEVHGRHPRRVTPPKQALDPVLASKLWIRTAELTGVASDPA